LFDRQAATTNACGDLSEFPLWMKILLTLNRPGQHGGSGPKPRGCNLTKDEFVALVAEKGAMTKADAGRAVDAFCGAVTAAMEKGEDIKLPGFGSFEAQNRGERQGRNLRTGEAITIAASKVVRFSPGSKLKGAANGKSEQASTKAA
jgi:DNA-binding protein HU-beta